MSTNASDRIEQALVVALAGFALWPNNICSALLIALVAIRIWRMKSATLPALKELWLLTPALLILISWAAYGFATDGLREVRLWPIWIAALVYFKSSPYSQLFKRAFIVFSLIQAALILAFLALSTPFYSLGFEHRVREAIGLQFHQHPTFIGAALCWAAVLLWINLSIGTLKKLALSALLLFVAALCGGKMPIIAAFVAATYLIFSRYTEKLKHQFAMAAAAFGVLLALLSTPVLRERVLEVFELDTHFESGDMLSSTQVRMGVWQCTHQLISEHWLWGVGVGNTRPALDACFANYEQSEFFEGEFNTHNQYAHLWLSGGLFSFLSFMAFCIWIIIHNLKTKNTNTVVFLLFFFAILLTENYLSRQFGMMLWSFFAASTLRPEATA